MAKRQAPHNNQSSSTIKSVFGCLLFLFIAAAGGALYANNWYQSGVFAAQNDFAESTNITIDDGKGLLDIAPELQEKGLLTDTTALRIYLRLEEPSIDIKKGNYRIPGGLNVPELIDALNAGPVLNTVRVTIQEGLRMDEVANRIQQAFADSPDALFSRSEYMKIVRNPQDYTFGDTAQQFLDNYKPANASLEGYLYPDTYVLGTDASALNIIDLQIRTLVRRLQEQGIRPDRPKRLANFHEVITLASILEREAGTGENLLIVSDIFLKRLEDGMALQADATYLYKKRDWKFPLTLDLLNTDTSNEYNTYVYPGLTPTPISNPGVEAINAAVNPKRNPYYYFITGNDGRNYYARTLQEHTSNIANYL